MSVPHRRIQLGLLGLSLFGFFVSPARLATAGPIWDHLTGKSKSAPCQNCAPVPIVMPSTANYPVSAYYPGYYPGYVGYPSVVANYPAVPASPSMAAVRGFAPQALNAYRPVMPTTGAVQAYRPWTNPGTVPSTIGATTPLVPNAAMSAVGAPLVAPVCPSCQRPMTVNIAPQVNYRTSWAQVPVTSFRPVAGFDPRTGQYVTVYQPCLTNSWQLQRVPTLLQRPALIGNATAVPTCVNGACGVVTGPVQTPYYGGSTVPAQGPLGGTPADQAPTLGRDGMPSGPQIQNYPPLHDVPPATSSTPGVGSSSSGLSGSITSGASTSATTSTEPGSLGNSSAVPTGPLNKSLLDPDRQPNSEIPPLLKSPPANRKASIPHPAALSLIPTRLIQRLPDSPAPESTAARRDNAVETRAKQPARKLPKLDDSGWRSVQP